MKLTVDQIVHIIRAQLRKQFEEGEDLGWYAETENSVTVDGNPNLKKIAEAIIREEGKD